MLFVQLDLPHRAFNANISLDVFWISKVLFNLVDLPFKGKMLYYYDNFMLMELVKSPLLLLWILFVHLDRCKLFSRISFFGRNNPTGLLFFYPTTTIPWWWSEVLKLYDLIASQWLKKKPKNRVWAAADSQDPRNWPRVVALFSNPAYLMTCVCCFFQYDALSFCFEFHASFHSHLFARQELN